MGKYLTAGEILSAHDLQQIDVACPEWATATNPEGLVKIQALSAHDREWFYMGNNNVTVSVVDGKPVATATPNLVNVRARLLSKAIVDENGKQIFDENEVEMIGAKSDAVVGRLFEAAQRLSGMLPDSVATAEKNSATVPNGG